MEGFDYGCSLALDRKSWRDLIMAVSLLIFHWMAKMEGFDYGCPFAQIILDM